METRNQQAYLIYNAFLQAMTCFRYRGLGSPNLELAKLYAVITDNNYLLARLEAGDTNGLVKLQAEMQQFLNQRISSVITMMIDFITTQLGLDTTSPMDPCIKVGTLKVKTDQLLTSRDYQLLDFEVTKICEYNNEFQGHGTKSSLARYNVTDLHLLLRFLIRQCGLMIMSLSSPQLSSKPITREIHGHDYVSDHNLAILSLLLIMVAKCHFQATTNIIMTADEQRQLQYKLVGKDFATYSKLGMMRYQSIICCYQYPQLLPIGVTNSDGSLDSTEKELLLSILILSQA